MFIAHKREINGVEQSVEEHLLETAEMVKSSGVHGVEGDKMI
jgi:hypothetical protein